MRDDLYPANESANGAGLLTVALVVLFLVAVMGANWLVELTARVL